MDFTPGERAVLMQIRVMYANTRKPEQLVTALMAQWPPIHYEAYRRAFASLVAKGLIQHKDDAQAFQIPDAGLKAMGAQPIPPSKPEVKPRAVSRKRPSPQPIAQPVGVQGSRTPRLLRWLFG